ncbi:jerky protein-like [Ruditapes philippinarum]|uniref:jerky protein-like n=1 Tax=Ruditapes philippinarum TaxID=129788 RepID=UPI00295B3393|nr:jerky protein-like [Ruditapes philippinarum]
MGPKHKGPGTPTQKKAKTILKKYGRRMTPDKRQRLRKALFSVSKEGKSLRKAAEENSLTYSFLYRRYSGKVDLFKCKGPNSVFTEAEEEKMAEWLSEMAQRGLGLKPCEFLDFLEDVVKREKRKTPFKSGRPGKKWYYAFLNRNKHIISSRTETDLELKRSKVTKQKTDEWYNRFKDFLIDKELINLPGRIWNADEVGFNMGANKSKVIGPARRDLAVPHITSGKQRLTVMFCGNAAGQMLPPYFVYPEPKPRGYNPLSGALEGADIAYTQKGWMNNITFGKFIDHFDKFAGPERPIVLLFDSVSSHIDPDIFLSAKAKKASSYIGLCQMLPT